METKRIGKILHATFGMGGRDDVQFGLSVTLGSDKESWRIGAFDGFWAAEPCRTAPVGQRDRQNEAFAKTSRFIISLLSDAGEKDVIDLIGKPVEVTFNGPVLQDWRILTEAI